MSQRQFGRGGSRVRIGTGPLLWLVLLLVALLACKKSSDDESESTAASVSDDSSEDEGSTAAKDEPEEKADEDEKKADEKRADEKKADEPKEIAGDPPTGGAKFSVGTPVDVSWGGSWWKATVIAVKDGPKYKIHYVGWASSWDEWVGPARIRPRTAGSRTK